MHFDRQDVVPEIRLEFKMLIGPVMPAVPMLVVAGVA